MSRLIKVHAPAARLGEITVISVELWTEAIHVHLAVEDGPAYEFDPATEPPDVYLGRLDLALADDVGTPYRPTGSAAGGTGTEWRAHWTFAPGWPPQATRLTVRLGDEELVL